MSPLNRFFKIILHDQKLKIPDKFVKKYGEGLSDSVSLVDPTGSIWFIGLKKIDDSIWLHEGMQSFLKDLSIKFGYFITFKYKGESTFKIRIFDLSVFEIDYPITSNSIRPDDSNLHQVHDDRRIESSGIQDSTRARSKINQKTTSRKKQVKIQAANTPLLKNPLYVCTLKPWNISRNIMNLPSEFSRIHLSNKSRFVKIHDVDGNEWDVYCICKEHRACIMSKGWAKFRRDNKLNVGDVCVFEPIRVNGEVTLNMKTSSLTIKRKRF